MIIKEECRSINLPAISSKTVDNMHILIWDFDSVNLYDVLKSLSYSQKRNGLGYIYVFKTLWGYNAVCLDKFHIKEVREIKLNTRFSDYWHTQIGYIQGAWCWFINNTDKKLIKVMPYTSTFVNRQQSNAHRLYLKKIYDIDINFGKFDKFINIETKIFEKDMI